MEQKLKIDFIYGYVKLHSWLEFDGKKYIGMGAKETFDRNGNVIDCQISPTGVILRYG